MCPQAVVQKTGKSVICIDTFTPPIPTLPVPSGVLRAAQLAGLMEQAELQHVPAVETQRNRPSPHN